MKDGAGGTVSIGRESLELLVSLAGQAPLSGPAEAMIPFVAKVGLALDEARSALADPPEQEA
ncbi:MAG: hypothetical protein MH204_02930 [Fimbriimonadaceae bacterium]|nr:hypothetical protein [Fimbriimonadaceae bacterium]